MILTTQKSQPTIEFFFDNTKGEMMERDTMRYFRGEYHEYLHEYSIHEDRAKLQAGALKFLCGYCHRPIHICGGMDEKKQRVPLHFRHCEQGVEDCPFECGKRLTRSEVEAMKYNGVRESGDHKRLKAFIAEYVGKTQMKGVKPTVKIEEVVHRDDSASYCRPDVFAEWKGIMDCAFELQLSTTFISVIDHRNRFYRSSGRYIMWVFARFFDIKELQRLTDIDVLVTNNYNVYVLDEEARRMSHLYKELFVTVHYVIPRLNEEEEIVNDEFQQQCVSINTLHFRESDHAIFFYDNEAKQEELKREIDSRRRLREEEERRKKEEELRKREREDNERIRRLRREELDKIRRMAKHDYIIGMEIFTYGNDFHRYATSCLCGTYVNLVYSIEFYLKLAGIFIMKGFSYELFFRVVTEYLRDGAYSYYLSNQRQKARDAELIRKLILINKRKRRREWLEMLFSIHYAMRMDRNKRMSNKAANISYYNLSVIMRCTGATIGIPIGTRLSNMTAVCTLFEYPKDGSKHAHLFLHCVRHPEQYINSKWENVYYRVKNKMPQKQSHDLDDVMRFLMPNIDFNKELL